MALELNRPIQFRWVALAPMITLAFIGVYTTTAAAQTDPAVKVQDSTSSAGAVLREADNDAEMKLAVTRLEKVGEHLFGDLGGLRSKLADRGLDYDLYYWSQTAAAVSGGKRTGIDYFQGFALQASADLGKTLGLTGLSAHTILIHRSGRSTSADYLDDHVTDVQQLYINLGNPPVHLAQLYFKQDILGGKVNIEAGRLAAGLEIATSPLYCEFASLVVCPTPGGLSGQVGYYGYASSTWGAKIEVHPRKDFYVQFGAFEVHPGLGGGKSGFNWSINGATGVVMPIEFGWTPAFGTSHLLGHYKIGFVHDTSVYKDFVLNTARVPITVSPGRPLDRVGRNAFYILADQMVYRTSAHDADGFFLFANYSHEDPNTAFLEQSATVGALAAGLVPGRPYDVFGFQSSWLKVSHKLRQAQQYDLAVGLPLESGANPLFGAPNGVQNHEAVLEGFYNFRVYHGIHVQPDVQYVIRPDATTRYANGTVLDLDVTIDF